jgi:beta-galactosidase
MKNILILPGILILLFISACSNTNDSLSSVKISGDGWKIWLDSLAEWGNDKIYLPGDFNLSELPVNKPGVGWENLFSNKGINCSLPATAEEYFGTSNEWTYHGVMWFYREIYIPDDFAENLVFINFESFRHRLELYVNEQLAGYDVIALTPYKAEISKFLIPGAKNRIALRITNPGGQRGWEDYEIINWNGHHIPHTYDYGGIAGDIYLNRTDSIYVEDVFVRNLLPAGNNKVEIALNISNSSKVSGNIQYKISIRERNTNMVVFSRKYKDEITMGENRYIQTLEVPKAKKWTIENPQLYTCEIEFRTNDFAGTYTQNFGFRVFELRNTDTGKKFFFNGNRIRLKTAIDWGQYAYNGLYPTHEMARNSVKAVKEVGHNMLSFHRRIGDKRIMNVADSLGVLLYEEPGGLHFYSDSDTTFIVRFMREKIRRMVVRARNHPGMIMYCLSNEDYGWSPWRKDYLKMINELDNSRFIVNSSGYEPIPNYHFKPYSNKIEQDYIDEHTVGSGSQFLEAHFDSHYPHIDTVFSFYGEVACYTGPPSVVELVEKAEMERGFDLNLYNPLYNKIQELFYSCKMDSTGNGSIRTPADITRQVSRGLMYSNGRLGQIIMSHDRNNGFAINGWSDGPQTFDAWSSAILDMGRNLKGPAEDMRYWNKPLQVAIFRNNGKYFKPGETASFRVVVINEGVLGKGSFTLHLKVKDGTGRNTWFSQKYEVDLQGQELFAQNIVDSLKIQMQPDWRAGHITVTGYLLDNNDTLAIGNEQVLLQNRSSWNRELTGKNIGVLGWNEASDALKETGIDILSYDDKRTDVVLVGGKPDALSFLALLERVKTDGLKMIISFNAAWADLLYRNNILSEKVTAWGGYQTHDWNGNGWGYLDQFMGDHSIPSGSVISTRSWEVPGNPNGFYPFKSYFDQKVFGLYLARSVYVEPKWGDLQGKGSFLAQTYTDDNQLLVLLASVKYGEGEIYLAPSYRVDENNAFNDMLFFNMILK